jgi:hypothetical protein
MPMETMRYRYFESEGELAACFKEARKINS